MGKAGCLLVDKYRSFRKKCGKSPVSADRLRKCRQLHPKEEPEEYLRQQDGALLTKIFLIFTAGAVMFFVIRWTEEKPEQVSFLERPGYGEGESYYQMEVQKGTEEYFSVEVPVENRIYTEQEAEEKFREAYEEICQIMPGENESLDKVVSSLVLPERLLGGIIEADWTSESRELFNDWGEIVKKPGEIDTEGEEGKYLVELSCGNYSCEYEILVVVYPPVRTEEESFLEGLREELEKTSKESREDENLELPGQYEGETLQWYRGKDREGRYLIMMFPLLAALLLTVGSRQKEKAVSYTHLRAHET